MYAYGRQGRVSSPGTIVIHVDDDRSRTLLYELASMYVRVSILAKRLNNITN